MQEILNIIVDNKILTGIIILVLFQLIWLSALQMSLRKIKKERGRFDLGEAGAKVEAEIAKHTKLIKDLDKDVQELYNISNQINNLASRGIHKVAMTRFNPFKDLGGDQSFSIALLNGKNNGITISSLHTREGTRVYSKTITSGKSEKYSLTEEEKEVVKSAMTQEMKKIT